MDEKTQYKILQRKDANFFLAMGGWGWVICTPPFVAQHGWRISSNNWSAFCVAPSIKGRCQFLQEIVRVWCYRDEAEDWNGRRVEFSMIESTRYVSTLLAYESTRFLSFLFLLIFWGESVWDQWLICTLCYLFIYNIPSIVSLIIFLSSWLYEFKGTWFCRTL